MSRMFLQFFISQYTYWYNSIYYWNVYPVKIFHNSPIKHFILNYLFSVCMYLQVKKFRHRLTIQEIFQAHSHSLCSQYIGTYHYMCLMLFCRSTVWLCNLFYTYNYNLQAKHLGHSFHPSTEYLFYLLDLISNHGWLGLGHQCYTYSLSL